MVKKPTVSISSLSFSGGQTFSLKSFHKVILVGPNNSGKSQTLREIFSAAQNGKFDNNLVVSGITINKDGGSNDLKDFLDENADVMDGFYFYRDRQINQSTINDFVGPYLSNSFFRFFVKK